MTISSALSNALSGLTASSRMAEIVSSNIANAMTAGYGRREVALSPRIAGRMGGVQIDGILRHADPRLIADRRLADAGLGAAQVRSDFLGRLQSDLGLPGEPGALPTLLAEVDSALLTAASDPSALPRLEKAAAAARHLAARFGEISDAIQSRRAEADHQIGRRVEQVNAGLARVRELNIDIARTRASGRDTSALQDQRQAVIDGIAAIVPLREQPRSDGSVALYSTGGAVLLDGRPATLGFDRTRTITPEMTFGGGALSGLTLNGRPIPVAAEGPVGGGALSALFDLRDGTAVEAQADLDALARDLVERFQAPGLDPTLGATDAGLFTDAGARFDPADEIGLSGRLSLNARADPAAGGAAWRLRAGLGAAAPGAPGRSDMLEALRGALTGPRAPASGSFASGTLSAADLTAAMLTATGTRDARAEDASAYAATRQAEFQRQELAMGVDTDQEMQTLLLVEQSYAANARVVETVDSMIQALMRI